MKMSKKLAVVLAAGMLAPAGNLAAAKPTLPTTEQIGEAILRIPERTRAGATWVVEKASYAYDRATPLHTFVDTYLAPVANQFDFDLRQTQDSGSGSGLGSGSTSASHGLLRSTPARAGTSASATSQEKRTKLPELHLPTYGQVLATPESLSHSRIFSTTIGSAVLANALISKKNGLLEVAASAGFSALGTGFALQQLNNSYSPSATDSQKIAYKTFALLGYLAGQNGNQVVRCINKICSDKNILTAVVTVPWAALKEIASRKNKRELKAALFATLAPIVNLYIDTIVTQSSTSPGYRSTTASHKNVAAITSILVAALI
jgi:hypothetical protein